MRAHLHNLYLAATAAFWLLPALMVLIGIGLALFLLDFDAHGPLPAWLARSNWIYDGGATGARTLLGAIASSMIGVAGTVFSITIAALSLAAGQMGPRLLRNFTRDRGNQFTLGAFLGTFSYALMVLRSVRTDEESLFTPHLSLTVGLALAFGCVATLVYFVGHMADRINVDTVIALVSADVHAAIDKLTGDGQAPVPPPGFGEGASTVVDARSGYLRHVDAAALADWAAAHGTALLLLRRPGDYVFPGAPIALMTVDVPGAGAAIAAHSVLASARNDANDVEDAVRQLVEVAVRALSPGINDPHTAMSVLDRLGAVLCTLAGRPMKTGVTLRKGVVALTVPGTDYERLVGLMLHMIRQNGATSTAVLLRMLDVLAQVGSCEHDPERRVTLVHHAELIGADARRAIANPADCATVLAQLAVFHAVLQHGTRLPPSRVAP